MSNFRGSPRLLKGGVVLVAPDTSAVWRIVSQHGTGGASSRAHQTSQRNVPCN